MQLFRLHPNPRVNASMYPDKYTYNQIRESGTFMQVALWKNGGEIVDKPATRYENHPITEWAEYSLANWLDSFALVEAVHEEWKERYDHDADRVHGSLQTLRTVYPEAIENIPRKGYTLQPCVFSDKWKVVNEPEAVEDVAKNYQNYVREAKSHLDWFKYEHGSMPGFLKKA